MTIKEILSKLKEISGTNELVSNLESQIEILENKGKAVESKNTEIQELKTKITELESKIEEKQNELEKIKVKWDSAADWFKSLYEEKKSELEKAKLEITNLQNSKTELETLKIKQEEKIKEDIELLYKEIPEDKKEFVKNMAERYPIEERIKFISEFSENFWKWNNKKKWWKIPSNDIDQEMEDAQKLYDNILEIPAYRRTHKQKKDLITLGKILSWKIAIK